MKSLLPFAVFVFLACADALGSARDDWHARAPDSYVVMTCGEGFAAHACTVEAVQTGHVVASETQFLPSDPWQPNMLSGDEGDPMESLFDSAMHPPKSCNVKYDIDATYSYLSDVYFDCDEEGWGTRVACFQPNTLDLGVCVPSGS